MCFFYFIIRNFIGLRNSVVLSVVIQVHVVVMSGRYVYSTELTECTSNTYLRINDDNSRTCVTCSACPMGHHVVSNCTRNMDTVCEPCEPGTYSAVSNGGCRNCSTCEPGYYVNRRCNISDDVTCAKCIDGYFSDSTGSVICRMCKTCRSNEIKQQECTGEQDTVCGECIRDHFRDAATLQCVPCSLCYANVSVVVAECQDKLGHSNEVCQPLRYVPRPKTEAPETTAVDATSTVYYATDDDRMNNTFMLVSVLTGLTLTSLLLLSLFVVFRHRKPQKVVRHIRDNCIKKTSKKLKSSLSTEEECCICAALIKKCNANKTNVPEKYCVDNNCLAFTELEYPLTKRYRKDQHNSLEEERSFCDTESGICCDRKPSDYRYVDRLSSEHVPDVVFTALSEVRGSDNSSTADSGFETISAISGGMTDITGRDVDAHGWYRPTTLSVKKARPNVSTVHHKAVVEAVHKDTLL